MNLERLNQLVSPELVERVNDTVEDIAQAKGWKDYPTKSDVEIVLQALKLNYLAIEYINRRDEDENGKGLPILHDTKEVR